MWVTGRTEQTLRRARMRWLLAIVLSGFSLIVLRLAYLQLVRGAALSRASISNHTQVLVERAPRGRILDRNGEVLAGDQPVFVAMFSPIGLGQQDLARVLSHLPPILDIEPQELERRLTRASRSRMLVRISDRLTRAKAFQILQDRIHLPGVSLTVEEQRFYPHDTLASHVLGYVGQITDIELEAYADQGYYAGDWIGKSGIERVYDPALHGKDGGYLIEVDVRGRHKRVLRHVAPQAGRDLVLTLDKTLQEMAESRLREARHPGAAVVVDPRSGEVLALASSPGFNPNAFLPLGDSEERKRLLADPALPLYNRAIQALYPPGSVFKIVSSLAALEKGIDPRERVFCSGQFSLGKERRIFKCWKPSGHGSMDFLQALAHSCDVYYYQMGLKTGPDAIEAMAKSMGLGALSGIDLPHEKRGLLPMAFKTARRRYWVGGDTLNYVIGQGDLQVTPMQAAQLSAQVAADGVMRNPFVVSKTQKFGEAERVINTPRVVTQTHWKAGSLSRVKEGLEAVVASGTGVAARLPGIRVAGKTGTAQAPKGDDHAWFVAYAPAESPRVALSVVVEHGGHGGSTAAPIAQALLARALDVPLPGTRTVVDSD